MIRVALKGSRAASSASLTAVAIILGVAMMSGAYVLTDTIDKAFDTIFVESYAGTDAVVSGKEAGINFEGESAQAPRSRRRRSSASGPSTASTSRRGRSRTTRRSS